MGSDSRDGAQLGAETRAVNIQTSGPLGKTKS